MGRIRNNMTIIHHYDYERISKVRENAVTYFESTVKEYDIDYNVGESMVSPILKSPVNDEYSFVIMGDCSKSGYDLAEYFDKRRRAWAKQQVRTS